MNLYGFSDYRVFLREYVASLPKRGRGELGRMSKAAGVHASVLSQVFQSQRDLSPEQAAALCGYLELSEDESQYFLLLVQAARAGTERLRQMVQRQIEGFRATKLQLVNRIPVERKLTEDERATFYSNWYYSGSRVLSSIPAYQSRDALAKRLRLSRAKTQEVLEFLFTHRLCIERDGKIFPGPQSTHLEAASPLVGRHHANWRIKAMEKHPDLTDGELAYTSPLSLSQADAVKVKERLVSLIQEVCATVDSSPAEAAYCLNLDWFQF